jgi:O-antigen/teichoic acid export membrane protein
MSDESENDKCRLFTFWPTRVQILMCSSLRDYVKRVWRSAMLPGILGMGFRVGANLLLLPLILDPRKLSSSELALWWVFVALGGFGSLADFGFGSTIARIYGYMWAGAEDFEAEGLRVAKTSASPNFAGISRVNVTVRSLYLKISMVAVSLLAVGGTLFLLRPIGQSGLGAKAWWLWAVYAVAIGYNLATSHWMLAVEGLNRIRDMQLAFVLSGAGYFICAAVLLVCNMGLASMVIASFVGGWILRWRCRQVYRQVVPESEQPVTPDAHIVRKLWPNACKFGILSIGSFCIANGGVLICSQFLGKEATASFGLTAKLIYFIMSFASLWLQVKWPEIVIMRTQGRLEQMGRLFARRLTLVMASYVGMGLVLFFAGSTLLRWKGSSTPLIPTPILACYLVYWAQQIFYTQFANFCYTENVVPFFRINLFTGLGSMVGSLILTPLFGLWGLVVAPFMVEMAYSSWFTVRRGFQGQPLTLRQFALAAIGGRA